ncbi:MAG TPA: GerMN domain-containing protein [Blastocatellia bacterium]|nr:GerMN domain-containing protein [Blastocatellia bacterium]
MKTTRVILTTVTALALLAGSPCAYTQRARPDKRQVRVYFFTEEDLESKKPSRSRRAASENLLALVPVFRMVSVTTPARGAIEALIAGPTDEEKSRGLRSPYAEGLSIKALEIDGGTARISLASKCADCPRWPGDLAPWRFREAVERTLKQFPTVKRVVICLDGVENFDDNSGEVRKCQ